MLKSNLNLTIFTQFSVFVCSGLHSAPTFGQLRDEMRFCRMDFRKEFSNVTESCVKCTIRSKKSMLPTNGFQSFPCKSQPTTVNRQETINQSAVISMRRTEIHGELCDLLRIMVKLCHHLRI